MSQSERWSHHGRHGYALDYTLFLECGGLVVTTCNVLTVCCDIGIVGFGEYENVLGWDYCPFVLIISFLLAEKRSKITSLANWIV
jgi:hypothetical protein